jgi:hypothetical protein
MLFFLQVSPFCSVNVSNTCKQQNKIEPATSVGKNKRGRMALMMFLARLNLKKVIRDERGNEQPNE